MTSDQKPAGNDGLPEEKDQKEDGGVGEFFRTLIIALAIALAIRTFLYEPFNIPSASMYPNLLVGDYLFVSKTSYGWSTLSIGFGLPRMEGRFWQGAPERGDIVVFKKPTDPSTDFIKRVIGMPGDVVEVVDSTVFINQRRVPRARMEDWLHTEPNGSVTRFQRFREILPNGATYEVLEARGASGGAFDNTGVMRVPEGHYLVMGDNRDQSVDSRAPEVGFVPLENLVGRAEILFFSIEEGTSFFQVWRWPFDLRWGRLFNVLGPDHVSLDNAAGGAAGGGAGNAAP